MTSAAASPNLPRGPRRRRPRTVGTGEVVGWFAGVVCAYWLYWLIAVPLIEPGIESPSTSYAGGGDVRTAHEAKSARKQALAKYFPPGSWELDNPAIWETDQTLLLFKALQPLDDNTVKLGHCTLLFFSHSRGAADNSRIRPIIVRVPEGATLKFDAPIVLKTVDFGKRKLIGGKLNGSITIVREASSPTAADDLLITTRDIELDGDRAFSPHAVHFRLGRSRGSGRGLEILLAGGGLGSGKVRTLIVKRDVKMNLVLDDPALAGRRPAAGQPEFAGSTLEIKCQGEFRYDFGRHAASFHDQVDVVRLSTGPSDLLNCQVLTVFLEQDDAQQPEAAGLRAPDAQANESGGSMGLPIRKIVARGDPVTLRSPARGIYLHCRRSLEFQPVGDDSLGRVVAVGPGVMQGVRPGDPPQKYRIQWTHEFRFEPAEAGQYVASLRGGAKVGLANLGEITANDRLDNQGRLLEQGQIVAWVTPITETPPPEQVANVRPVSTRASSPIDTPPDSPPSGSGKWQIERVRAEGIVVVDVPQLDCTTSKLEVWFERPPVTGAGTSGAPSAAANHAATDVQPPARRPGTPPRNRPTQRFSVRAGGVQAKLAPDGEQFALADLTLYDQAYLEELTPRPGEKPMIVAGDRLHVTGANTERTHVTVVGQPARIEGGGVDLMADKIELERHTNHLWVGGPGRMIMPIDQDLNGHPLPQSQTAEITWQGRMDLLANRVIYERDVRVTSQHQLLTTAKLEGFFDRAIDFSNPGAAAPGVPAANGQSGPQLAFVRCHGETVLDSREFDERGAQTSADRMQVFDLSINRTNGDIKAKGPGWFKHVGRESGGGPLGRPAGPEQNRPPAKIEPQRPGLIYLRVEFQKKVAGNLDRRVMTFSEPTETVYAPVDDWNAQLDAEDPKSLGPDGMVLVAKELTVREMPARAANGEDWFELVATGNVLIEGAQFAAASHRATYSQDKDQLVLEGDGRNPAEISFTAKAGGQRNRVKFDRITYLIGRQYVSLTGAHSLHGVFPQPRGPVNDKK